MQSCWLTPESRPTSTQIYLTLTDLLQVFTVCKAESQNSIENSQGSQESFDMRWNSLKPNNLNTSDNSAEMQETQAKPMSPSLNNLIGSLDDVHKPRNFDDDNTHSTFLSGVSHQKFEFELGPQSREPMETDSLNDSMVYTMQRSSSSETEEENWKTKIERGAYTEKVRQKSRSVTDLMVLTHIDCSESESETPQASLDHKVNYKNVRLAPKNLEKSFVHGSEGNLLSVEDDFQAELRKLQEEHRDSLFFVPDKYSQNEQINNNLVVDENNCVVDAASSSSGNLMKELNSTSDIKPTNQVYNVFNVTIDKLSPVHIVKLNEIINLEEPTESKPFVPYEVPKLCDIIQNNSNVANLTEHMEYQDEIQSDCESKHEEICINNSNSNSGNNNCDAFDTVEKHSFVKRELFGNNSVELVEKLSQDEIPGEFADLETSKEHMESQNVVPVNLDNLDENLSDKFEKAEKLDVVLQEGLAESPRFEVTDQAISCQEKVPELVRSSQENLAKTSLSINGLQSFECINDFLIEERRVNNFAFENESVEAKSYQKSLEQLEREKIQELLLNSPCVENVVLPEILVQTPVNLDSPPSMKQFLEDSNDQSLSAIDKAVANRVEVEQQEIIPQLGAPQISFENAEKEKQVDTKPPNKTRVYQVPKLIDIIENNDKLMDYIIANYESELNDDLSCENSYKTTSTPNKTTMAQKPTEENSNSEQYPVVDFDLSDTQEATNPNSLTHLNVFSKQKSLDFISSTPTKKSFSSLSSNDDELPDPSESTNLNYSLETWDNFLGNAMQNRNAKDQSIVFESLNSEPQSLLFIEGDDRKSMVTPPNSDIEVDLDDQPLADFYGDQTINIDEGEDLNRTFIIDGDQLNETYSVSELDSSYSVEDGETASGTWESNGGWFLHPQSSASVSGHITEQKDDKSYVRFGMDDEILAALRGELLAKLPHAQGTSNEKKKENEEEWDPSEKDEVFLRYNVYNTPLSPILEESEGEENDDVDSSTPVSPASEASDDWPEKFLDDAAPQESQSLKAQGLLNQHTLSQDSCCSNDTLFNLEDMACIPLEQDKETIAEDPKIEKEDVKRLQEEQIQTEAINYFKNGTALGVQLESPIVDLESPMDVVPDKGYLVDFLAKEREHSELVAVVITEATESDSNSSKLIPLATHVAPLPSPDDHPWKQLSASLLNYDRSQKKGLLDLDHESDDEDSATLDAPEEQEKHSYENVENELCKIEPDYSNTVGEDVPSYVNVETEEAAYQNIDPASDTVNEADYVNITNLENCKINEEFNRMKSMDLNDSCECEFENNSQDADDLIIREVVEEEDQDDQIFGVLTDIRFSGPGESHLMSTSFSESNELNNEQDWDSGSDTRSSSSGEFIWKLEDKKPRDNNEDDTSSESSCSDEEGECPEFIPSAWDKYATPTKSALRSPEKTLEKEEKKKGVWFKKQRYHCVYEYPREPESPLHSLDLWNSPPPVTSYPEWYFDIDSTTEFNEFPTITNLAETETVSSEFNTNFNNEFYVTSTATPFDMMRSTTSQFFPGSDNWSDVTKLNENTTPDSGVEDSGTPGSLDALDFARLDVSKVPTLKFLAGNAYSKLKQKENEDRTNKVLGGLRHTRDKLKLDLPPSPNTFTSNKTFNLEPTVDPVVLRERPSFTTFGKSRFLVQHVDTPDKDENGRNVCFEVLPYRPPEKREIEQKVKKIKKEEKGEASLLDSADEDSGIESSTLERKTCDVIGKLIVD